VASTLRELSPQRAVLLYNRDVIFQVIPCRLFVRFKSCPDYTAPEVTVTDVRGLAILKACTLIFGVCVLLLLDNNNNSTHTPNNLSLRKDENANFKRQRVPATILVGQWLLSLPLSVGSGLLFLRPPSYQVVATRRHLLSSLLSAETHLLSSDAAPSASTQLPSVLLPCIHPSEPTEYPKKSRRTLLIIYQFRHRLSHVTRNEHFSLARRHVFSGGVSCQHPFPKFSRS
jgi:hypothetical protein